MDGSCAYGSLAVCVLCDGRNAMMTPVSAGCQNDEKMFIPATVKYFKLFKNE